MDNPLKAGSPPPAQLDEEAPRPLPSLPTEILQRIIQVALPRLSFKTFRERYDILLVLCRVNKLWAALAQRELYRHVWLNHEVAADAYLANSSSTLLQGTNSLRLNEADVDQPATPPAVTTTLLDALLKRLPKLSVLHATSKTSAHEEGVTVDLSALSRSCPDLERLAIDFCRIAPSANMAPQRLSFLRHLALSYFADPSDLELSLRMTDLPRLESLVFIQGYGTTGEDIEDLAARLSRYAPQLKAFTLSFADTGPHNQLPSSFWSALSSLEALALDHDYTIPSVLQLLPAPLRRLQVRPSLQYLPPLTFSPVADALKAPPPSIKYLKELLLPPAEAAPNASPNGPTLRNIQRGRAEVEELCRALKVEVVTEDRFAYEDYIGHLEHALSFR
ncbi:hypothetical protein BCR35DRAFT_298143 [Leucosporidium creatinivorum]|uniref:F-box domain-containing protein n=1 Tax=Leucosporidium creatinivorum TaxID=106004 RepID=A0A1Y2G418_9BASI|nr:hypothetical protein BCR35DRAFT_298143 [Leucosporidium creatinivorum]